MDIKDYKFTIFSYPSDYFWYMFKDIVNMDNVDYIKDPFLFYCPNKCLKFLYKIHTNVYLNKIVSLPYKRYWDKYLFNYREKVRRKEIFVFLMRWLKPQNEKFFILLKKRVPDCKIIIYLEDLRHSGINSLDYSLIDKYADLVISYDKSDSEKYGYLYYPTFLSNLDNVRDSKYKETDVCFYGAEKERGKLILDSFEVMTNNGYVCDFGIYKSKRKNRKRGIKYLRRLMPYSKYLRHANKSKYLLEIMQEGAIGYTLRCWEAIVLKKKLLTNNPKIFDAPFYNPNQFGYFSNPSELPEIIKKMNNSDMIMDNTYSISPIKFLYYIISKL